jgi:hypothetical protein
MKIITSYTILGILMIIAGVMTIIDGTVALGLLYAIHLEEDKKYIVAIPEIMLGTFILYHSFRYKKE